MTFANGKTLSNVVPGKGLDAARPRLPFCDDFRFLFFRGPVRDFGADFSRLVSVLGISSLSSVMTNSFLFHNHLLNQESPTCYLRIIISQQQLADNVTSIGNIATPPCESPTFYCSSVTPIQLS